MKGAKGMIQKKPMSVLAVLRVDNGDFIDCNDEIHSLARQVPGINDIHIDTLRHRILVLYNGDPSVLGHILLTIRSFGLNARLFSIPCIPQLVEAGMTATP